MCVWGVGVCGGGSGGSGCGSGPIYKTGMGFEALYN